jgi:hypothetical protein
MVSHKSLPQVKLTVTTGGVAYVIDSVQTGKIVRNENGFDIADFMVSDDKSTLYPTKIAGGSLVTCEMKDGSEAAWTTVFNGVIRFCYVRMSELGWNLELKCDGAGYGFGETAVGEEFGTESRNPTLDKISEILTDANHGVIPKWVNSILGSATSSGYGYTYANVEDIAGSMRYVYFPFKPCNKALADVCDLLQAIKGANAGCHWIVGTDDKFRLKTVGSDQAGWDDYYGGSQAASTLEEGVDHMSYSFEDLTKEANYVLYHAQFRKPADGDKWTEETPFTTYWQHTNATLSAVNGAGFFKVGTVALEATPDVGVEGLWYYPQAGGAGWNLEVIGGKYNVQSLNFFMRINSDIEAPINVVLYKDATNYFLYDLVQDLSDKDGALIPDQYFHISIPIGPYAKTGIGQRQKIWQETGTPSWTLINSIRFRAKSKAGVTGGVYLDGLHFAGWVLRAAKEAGIGTTNKLKVKVVTDEVDKDDSGNVADDSGVVAQLAKAELYRCKTTPLVGEIRVPYLYDLLPGQLLHIHAKKTASGTFNIDRDMRAVRVEHDFDSVNGFTDRIAVTSDVINSYPRMAWTNMNRVLADARPESQDRQATSLKMREIDITQTIVETEY